MKKKVALVFPRELVGEPITYKLIKDYNLIINILKAKIIPYKEGKLDIEISGEKENLNRGIGTLGACAAIPGTMIFSEIIIESSTSTAI